MINLFIAYLPLYLLISVGFIIVYFEKKKAISKTSKPVAPRAESPYRSSAPLPVDLPMPNIAPQALPDLPKVYSNCPACDYDMFIYKCGGGHKKSAPRAGLPDICSEFGCGNITRRTIDVTYCGSKNRSKDCARNDKHLHQSCSACGWSGLVQTISPI